MDVPTQRCSKTFRVAIFPTFAAICSLGFLLYLLLIVTEEGLRGINVEALLFGGLAAALGSFVGACLMALCFTLKLTPEGVFGHSAWGIRRFIRWQDIATAKPFRFFNLRYLRLYPETGRRPIWIALFQARKAEFEQGLQMLAPADSPVRQYLR
jgi:hypothetical protein